MAPVAPVEGNTKASTSKAKKRGTSAKCWLFVWNNYPEDWLALLAPVFTEHSCEWIVGEEVGEKGTPHLQGYVECPVKCRPVEKYKLSEKIHWGDEKGRPCKGSRLSNVTYCSKDGKFKGSLKPPTPLVKMTWDKLKPSQKLIASNFSEKEDPLFGRLIWWFWEPTGGVGKSVMCKYFVDCCGALILSGSAADMKFGVMNYVQTNGEGPSIVVMDIPRVQDSISIKGLEEVKNGNFFSSKYESGMVRYNSPHVIVFANKPPNLSDMSANRWRVYNMNELDINKGDRWAQANSLI